MALTREEGPSGDEARIARLYRLASDEEPPARLDAPIAAAARRRAEASGGEPAPRWWQAWRVPFAFAAVAVVSVSLVTVMLEEGGERLASVPEAAPPRTVVQPKAAEPEQAPAELAAVPAESGMRERRAQEPAPARAASAEERKTEAADAAASTRDTMALERGRADKSAKALDNAAPPSIVAASPPESLGSAAGAQRAPSARLEREASPERPAAQDRAATEPRVAQPSAAPAPAPFPAAKPAPAERPAPALRRFAYETGESARPSSEVAQHIAQLENQPPAAWIARILALRKETRFAEADGVLAEFRRRYPSEPIPPSLQ